MKDTFKNKNIAIVLSAAGMIFLTLLIVSACADRPGQALRVMSFNIRYDNPDDGENAWVHRRDAVASMIRFHKADVVGVQEALARQIDDLTARLPGFDWFGVGRDDGKKEGEFTAVLYRTRRLMSEERSTFWLSETPDRPGLGWDAACNRTVTWGRFVDVSTRKVFFFFNTHFDHRGEKARTESARLLLSKIDALAPKDTPVVITGDFNCTPDSEPYQILTLRELDAETRTFHDACRMSGVDHHGPTGTFTGFDIQAIPGQPIDYILVSREWQVLFHGTLSDTFDGRYPSDHMPVLAEIFLE